MQTQCPECNKQRSISTEELRSSLGMICCEGCSTMFDALELLNDENTDDLLEADEILLPLKSSSGEHNSLWGIGYTICIILFLFQIYFFEGYNLTQNTFLRPWLKTICSGLHCQLPVYKNLNEITILHGAFEATKNDTYIFKTAFSNQSAFEQRYPSIKLTLQNFSGQTFAERVFQPQEYTKKPANLIGSNTSTEITMEITAPSNKMGGYRFELI